MTDKFGVTFYRVFKRSATNWKEFARARKITIARNVDGTTARQMCEEFNSSRTPAQVKRGTKMEFEAE